MGSDNPTHTSVTRSGYCVTVAFPCVIGGSANSRSSGARCSGFRGTSPNIVILVSDGSMDGTKAASTTKFGPIFSRSCLIISKLAKQRPPDRSAARISVKDISPHSAPDLHVYHAHEHSVRASLVRDYLD
jgi:hypothetical protein